MGFFFISGVQDTSSLSSLSMGFLLFVFEAKIVSITKHEAKEFSTIDLSYFYGFNSRKSE